MHVNPHPGGSGALNTRFTNCGLRVAHESCPHEHEITGSSGSCLCATFNFQVVKPRIPTTRCLTWTLLTFLAPHCAFSSYSPVHMQYKPYLESTQDGGSIPPEYMASSWPFDLLLSLQWCMYVCVCVCFQVLHEMTQARVHRDYCRANFLAVELHSMVQELRVPLSVTAAVVVPNPAVPPS